MGISKKTLPSIGLVIVIILVILLLCRFVFFKEQFENRSDGLQRIADWQADYKIQHPNATDEEMNKAREQGIADIQKRQADYKAQHPNATDEEMEHAWNALWGHE